MRKIVVSEFVSLDGVMEDPSWTFPFGSEEQEKFKFDELFASDALLLGRVTYEGFAVAWPSMTDEAGFSDRMNSLPKYVVSTTLEEPLEWNNSLLIRKNVVEEISNVKEQPGQDILLGGSADLVNTLMDHDLVDEYQLMVFPVVVGSGKRLFRDGRDTKALKHIRTQTFGSGVVVLTYGPIGDGAEE
ncbi:MAG: dihydrofolate reductase family protein [Actinobacteria bacterium]|nr:dihydrofolate reductase family protein [Actinomycetota bacterium]